MSQSGILKVRTNILPPVVPTSFVTDSGIAIPIANVLQVLGTSVVAGSTPVRTTGATNIVTVEVQTSQAIAATDATKIGLAAFNNTEFTVDANGFVSLIGGSLAIDSIGVDAATAPGTNPVLPTAAGLLTITGAQVAAGTVGTNVIRTDSLAANTFSIEIQRSQAVATTTVADNGVCHFDSAKFTVDANGFVSASGTGLGQTITGNSGGALSPTAGNWNIVGATVAAGTSPLVTAGSGSTLTINAQRSQALASADSTKVGLSNFNSTDFTVDSNGFVSLTGTNLTVTCQRFTSTGNFIYTPTTGMKYVIAELCGGGGGGGGTAATTANVAVGGPGGGGAYAKFILTAAQVGASLSGSVGAGGGGGSAGANNGAAGGSTTLATASPWTCAGGALGLGGAAGTSTTVNAVAGGAVTTGTGTILLISPGGQSGAGSGNVSIGAFAPTGGSSRLGNGGPAISNTVAPNGSPGSAGSGFGWGAGAANSFGTGGPFAGTSGGNGVAIFTEFIFV